MIDQFQFYYGIPIISLINEFKGEEFTFKEYASKSRSSYILKLKDGNEVGLYIKYSTRRLRPWYFTFKKEHQDEILAMKNEMGNVFVFLVCAKDGVAVLNFDELKCVLDETHEEFECIAVTRKDRGRYSISGRDGKLDKKIVMNDYKKVINLK